MFTNKTGLEKKIQIAHFTFRVAVYMLLFGFSGDPFLELTPAPPSGKIKFSKDSTGNYGIIKKKLSLYANLLVILS
jgi:hypothetical protein